MFLTDHGILFKVIKISRYFNKLSIIMTLVLIMCSSVHCFAERSLDYTRLVELIQLEDKQQPLCVFNDFEEEFDEASHRATLQYFNDHPGLIQRIKNALKGENLRWKLGSLEHRLLFVPERRLEYARLYKNYCRDIIDTLLDKIGLDNPYDSIQILQQSKPANHHEGNDGITAYIVHNLAREYVGTYIFFNQTGQKVKIRLEGKLYIGEVGAYSSTLTISENGAVEFLKGNYTVWQNSALNPYTALMVPAEETLHIVLREHTEAGIKKTIERGGTENVDAVKRIVEDWMAVEEAIVGGIIHRLLPQMLADYVDDLPGQWIEKDLEAKSRYIKYRHLRKGIMMVEDMGYKKALELYTEDPLVFRWLLI